MRVGSADMTPGWMFCRPPKPCPVSRSCCSPLQSRADPTTSGHHRVEPTKPNSRRPPCPRPVAPPAGARSKLTTNPSPRKATHEERRVGSPSSVPPGADRDSAQARLKAVVAKHESKAPKLTAWMEENIPQGFNGLALPSAHQRRLRASNAIERVNQELKRRPRVATLFPNEASVLRL
ncbi:MAG: transposase, partial [Verrucomicrobiota bacterium]